MAMRMAVTTWPLPRSLSTPNTDIGATGWITITPYRIRSQSVSVLRRRGAEETSAVSVVKGSPFAVAFRFAIQREPFTGQAASYQHSPRRTAGKPEHFL